MYFMVDWVVLNYKRTNYMCVPCRFLSESAFAYTAFSIYNHHTMYSYKSTVPDLFMAAIDPRVPDGYSVGDLFCGNGLENPAAGYHFINLGRIENG